MPGYHTGPAGYRVDQKKLMEQDEYFCIKLYHFKKSPKKVQMQVSRLKYYHKSRVLFISIPCKIRAAPHDVRAGCSAQTALSPASPGSVASALPGGL
jgi:hypothetical protein